MRTELDRIAENNYAREQGLEQGKADMRKIDVLKFLAFGLSPENIAKALEMPLEEVKAIQAEGEGC
ncbi:MAG: hypothetical protein J5669_00500 [Bacteroidales bacterium]|nr:hypothetical protein [Bacteroidales bacterium]